MSSNYHVICLGHDPAIRLDRQWNNAAEAVAAATDPAASVRADHPNCDLVIGRWSGGLIEIGCPSSTPMTSSHLILHGSSQWTEVGWLRLLAAADDATSEGATALATAVTEASRCWSAERVRRLRNELQH